MSVNADRIRGSLLGLACGDALEAPVEFCSREEIVARYGVLKDFVAGGGWKRGEWTDDTALALCVCEGIIEAPHDPVMAIGERFLAWYRSGPKDVGTTTRVALQSFAGNWAEAGRRAASQRPAGANGSLMRTVGVALAYPDRHVMLGHSARISAMTHWGPDPEACCAVYCLWVHEILNGADPHQAWYTSIAEVRSKPSEPTSDAPGTRHASPELWQRLEKAPKLPRERWQPSGYAGYVVECLEAAAAAVLQTHTLEDALVALVNLGGETDTMAAVAGGVAGAIYGAQAIPSRWLSRLMHRERLEKAAQGLERVRGTLLRSHVPERTP